MTDEEEFHLAVQQGMLALRVIAGKFSVCPVCFCGAVSDELEIMGAQLEHNVPLSPMTMDEVQRALFAFMEADANAKRH